VYCLCQLWVVGSCICNALIMSYFYSLICLRSVKLVTALAFQHICTTLVIFTLFLKILICMNFKYFNLSQHTCMWCILTSLTSILLYNFALYVHNCIRFVYYTLWMLWVTRTVYLCLKERKYFSYYTLVVCLEIQVANDWFI